MSVNKYFSPVPEWCPQKSDIVVICPWLLDGAEKGKGERTGLCSDGSPMGNSPYATPSQIICKVSGGSSERPKNYGKMVQSNGGDKNYPGPATHTHH